MKMGGDDSFFSLAHLQAVGWAVGWMSGVTK